MSAGSSTCVRVWSVFVSGGFGCPYGVYYSFVSPASFLLPSSPTHTDRWGDIGVAVLVGGSAWFVQIVHTRGSLGGIS
jgi:hypothetical protein